MTVIKRAILNLYIPKVKMKSRKYPHWFNADIIQHLNCLRSLRRRLREHSTDQSMARLKSSEKFLRDKCLSAKASCESNLVCSSKSNTSLIFKHINSITGNNTIPPIVKLETSATSDHEKALIVTFIQFLLTCSSFALPSVEELSTPEFNLTEISISELDVFRALSSLNPTKAGGIDGIGPRVLKFCAVALYQPIHHLVFLSTVLLKSGVFIVLLLFTSQGTDLQSRITDQYRYYAPYLRFCKGLYIMLLLNLSTNPSHLLSLASYGNIQHCSNYYYFRTILGTHLGVLMLFI